MAHLIETLPQLNIGKLNEHGVTSVEIDISAWVAQWEDIVCSITMIAPGGGSPFPVTGVTQDGDTLTWLVGSDATVTAGTGSIVVHGEASGIGKRSAIADVIIADGHATVGAPPSALEDWLARAMEVMENALPLQLTSAPYATIAALKAAVTDPELGALYAVGASDPYDIWYWSGDEEAGDEGWINLGPIRGESGVGVGLAEGGTVRQVSVKLSGTDYDTGWADALLQYSTMPTPAVGNLGQVAQYIGATTVEAPIYTLGHVYRCVSDGGTPAVYSWSEIVYGDPNSVSYSAQTGKTAEEKTQARTNIAAQKALTVTGIPKLDGSGNDSAAVANVDYTSPAAIAMLSPGGVFSGGAVTAQGTPDQTVAVSECAILTPEGKRYVAAAVSALAAAAADATNPRIDIVYLSSAGVVTYLAGTAAASPAQPATPTNGTLLAAIARAANDNTIASGDITDQRRFLSLASDSEIETPVVESSNTFTCDLAKKATRVFTLNLTDGAAKTVVFSNVPYGPCNVLLLILTSGSAGATITWTLDGRTVSWPQGSPSFTTASRLREVLLEYSTQKSKWIGRYGDSTS